MDWREKYLNKVTCGDCLELMRGLPDKCVDAVITDFPYGVGYNYNTYDDTTDNLKHLIDSVLPEMMRVSTVVLFSCGNRNQYMYPTPSWTLAWVEMAGVGSTEWGFSCWQPLLAYGKDPYLANCMGRRPDTYIGTGCGTSNKEHPCAKPIEIMKWMINRATVSVNTIILDPFLGSGTTAVAAIRTGRQFIGFEIDDTYCTLARKRIADELAQIKIPFQEQYIPEQEKLSLE